MSSVLLSISSIDNRNVSSTLMKKLKETGLFPKNNPSQIADTVMILQEVFYLLRQENTGMLIEGEKMIYYTAEKLAEKITHLAQSTIASRLRFMVDIGLLIAVKAKNHLCWHAKYYGLGNLAKELVSTVVDDFYTYKNRFADAQKPILNKQQLSKQEEKENIEQDKNFEERPCVAERRKGMLSDSDFSSRQYSENESDRSEKSQKDYFSEFCEKSNSQDKTNVPRIDEKVNSKPVLKKDMARHIPEGDRYFNNRNQQSEIRGRAKMDSVLGFSEFKSIEDMRECQKQLTLYFAQKELPEKAAEKASWIIKAERQGERSPFVQDYLDGVAIGSWCQKEWEIEPGVIAPVLIAYLRCKLRKNGDTHAHSLNRVSWELKDSSLTANHWAECKRLIDIEKPRLTKALQRGQDLVNQNIPEWIIEIYRPEIPVERAAETAEVLGAIATQYNDRIEQVQRQLEPVEYAENLLEESKGSALFKLKKALGLPTAEKACNEADTRLIEEQERKKAEVDAVMDRIVSDGKRLELSELLPNLPKAKLIRLQSETEEISELLSDPITRETGLRRAQNLGLPILYSSEGEAIAIDTLSIKNDEEINFNNISRDGQITSSEEKYQAHQVYQPEQIEKGSKSAWEEAIAKSKFLKNRLKRDLPLPSFEGKRPSAILSHEDGTQASSFKRQIPPDGGT